MKKKKERKKEKKKQNFELKRDVLVFGETYEGKSRGSESRSEPAPLEPLPPGALYAFFAGDDEGNCAGLDEPA